MKRHFQFNHLRVIVLVLAGVTFASRVAFGHCDTMDGPVVKAAVRALESGDVNLVLIWVQKKDEPAIKEAFQKTLAVRKLSGEAKTLADMYFFETLVRIHRAGEGVAYTGLKPAGTEVEPGIEAADHALEKGSAEELLKHLDETIHHRMRQHFSAVMAKSKFDSKNVEAGREYVKAYVEFIHYVERLYAAAARPASGHLHEAETH